MLRYRCSPFNDEIRKFEINRIVWMPKNPSRIDGFI